MCASHSVLIRPERRNESKFDELRSLPGHSVAAGRSNSPPVSPFDDLAEL
jgi:hypothetical protein